MDTLPSDYIRLFIRGSWHFVKLSEMKRVAKEHGVRSKKSRIVKKTFKRTITDYQGSMV